MAAGAGVPVILLLPETYLPVILQKNAMKDCSQEETRQPPGAQAFSARRIFSRPFLMLVRKPIVAFTSLYLAVVYGILFLFFQAYPVVFQGMYRLSTSDNGLAFIPMIFGSLLGLGLVLVFSSNHSKAIAAEKSWALVEEYRRLPLACVGAVSIVIALFWLGWSSYCRIHPALPMMAGIFFGFGYFLVFAAMLNYLTGAYKEASASAQAAASATRAIMAVVLPFAATPMYTHLGIHWASSLLGFLAFALAGIPFAFIRYGSRLRQSSGLVVGE